MDAPHESPGTNRDHRQISIEVDGETYPITDRTMTPNDIIRDLGHLDPATHYLVQILRNAQRSFEGKGDQTIVLLNGERFQIISTGPTTVSDQSTKVGVDFFVEGLRALGFKPIQLEDRPDHVVFDYTVESGKFSGREVKHGFVVPCDFPLSVPSGPHVSPQIHPIQSSGGHPTGGIHEAHARPFRDALGGEWQYWSRPFNDWNRGRKTVAAYMSHIWRLWHSQ